MTTTATHNNTITIRDEFNIFIGRGISSLIYNEFWILITIVLRSYNQTYLHHVTSSVRGTNQHLYPPFVHTPWFGLPVLVVNAPVISFLAVCSPPRIKIINRIRHHAINVNLKWNVLNFNLDYYTLTVFYWAITVEIYFISVLIHEQSKNYLPSIAHRYIDSNLKKLLS